MISVIIPTLNEEDYILNCLQSIRENNFRKDYEIIVVDCGSTDKTVLKANELADKVILSSRGVSIQRNAGVRVASFDKIVFTDADITVKKNWLSKMNYLLDYNDLVYGPAHVLSEQKIIERLSEYSVEFRDFFNHLPINFLKMVNGANIGVRKKFFLELGGFDERKVSNEDLDIVLRALKKGVICYDKDLLVYHSDRYINMPVIELLKYKFKVLKSGSKHET